MNRVQFVAFDVTNTLMRFKVSPGAAYQQVCRQYGVTTLDDDQLLRNFSKHYKATCHRFPNFGHGTIGCRRWWYNVVSGTIIDSGFQSAAHSGNEGLLAKIFEHLYESFSSEELWVLDGETLPVLEELKRRGLRLGVISNTDDRLEAILKNLRVRPYFDVVINSYQAGVAKPHRGIFDLAISLANNNNNSSSSSNPAGTPSRVLARQAVHIGDSLELDFEGAKSAGWHSLLLSHSGEPKPSGIDDRFVLNCLSGVPNRVMTL